MKYIPMGSAFILNNQKIRFKNEPTNYHIDPGINLRISKIHPKI